MKILGRKTSRDVLEHQKKYLKIFVEMLFLLEDYFFDRDKVKKKVYKCVSGVVE